jgi:mono/diheme cytochrome c family protein
MEDAMKKLLLISMALGLCSLAGQAISEIGFGDAAKGSRLYAQRCTVCHGRDGRGQNGMAPDFFEEWHRLTKTDEELAGNIRNDFRSPDGFYNAASCPSHALTDEELGDVVAYLRELTGYQMNAPFEADPFDKPMDADPFDRPMESDPFNKPIEFR